MTNLPKMRVRYGEGVGVEVLIAFPDISNNERTFLDANVAASVGSMTANGSNFAVGQYIVIGTPGTERCEIIKIHASTPPSATTITLASNTVYAHNRGEQITFIPYNQIELSNSTDGVSYSALSAVSIRPDERFTYIQRPADLSSYYYKFRFKNSTDTTYSQYSDAVIATGFADNSVHSIKSRALRSLGEKVGALITDQFLMESLSEGRRELDQDPRVLRWTFRTKFNTDIGDVIPGRWSVAAPTDLRDTYTFKNILGLRVGRKAYSLSYQDENVFADNYRNIAHTTLASQAASGATSIALTSSGDFDESGTVYLAAESVSGTLDAATYTANTESTATLSGAASVTDTHAAGRDVWQGASFGTPLNYTINAGVVYFDVPFEDDLAGENIFMDYYQALQAVDSDADTLDEPFYDLFVPYLRWKIKYLKSNGKLRPQDDGDYAEWLAGKERVVSQEVGTQDVQLVPDYEL